MYKENYDKARFHIEFGPASLFERVSMKMKNVRQLYLEGAHFRKRLIDRSIPDNVIDKLLDFDSSVWKLKTAEVRTDRGKFVNSTWEITIDHVIYWVTIGMGNYIKTIIRHDSSGVEKCIRNGELYDMVERVNRELIDSEQ